MPADTLLVDLGNSRLKWCWYDALEMGPVSAALHRDEETCTLLDHCWGELPRPDRVLLASVANSDVVAAINDWVVRRWDRRTEVVRSSARTLGVINAYSEPHRLGVDRWLALVAVHRRSPSAACIVDCGSAITLDGLAPDGRHLGGLILPGLSMMRESLLAGTHIGPVDEHQPFHWLAPDTAGAVAFGGLLACTALVERLAERITQHCGTVAQVIVTGGDGGKLMEVLERECSYRPDLVLQGLAEIAGEPKY